MHNSMLSLICLSEKNLLPKFYIFFAQRQTSNTDINVPFYLEKDEVFLLSRNIMRTHARRVLLFSDTIFNYRLPGARIEMKYTFRMLNKKHIILGKPAETTVKLANA